MIDGNGVGLFDGNNVGLVDGTGVAGLSLVGRLDGLLAKEGLGDWVTSSEGAIVVAGVGAKVLSSVAMEGLGEWLTISVGDNVVKSRS